MKPTRNSIVASCIITFILFFVHSVLAANDTWVGGGADANWATIANWAAVAAPVNNDTLAFNGTTQQINTNNISNLSVGSVTFTNGGFNLYGNPLTVAGVFTDLAGTNIISMDLTDTVNNTTWNIASGSELRLGGAFIDTSGTTPLANLSGAGTLRITSTNFVPTSFFTQTAGTVIFDGAVVSMLDGYRLRPSGTAVVQFTNNGSLTIGLGGNLRLCQNTSGGYTEVDMSSGKLNIATTTGGGAGDLYCGEAASTTTVFNQNGGLVEFTGNGDNRLGFCNASASANGTYNLNGGLLWVKVIAQITAGSPGGTFNFNGGTLKPTVSSATFFQGVQAANIQSGGAIIDTTNLNITIGESLPGVGGLTKLGTGNLTLSGTDSYSGNTVVSNGDLITTTASTGAGSYSVSDGAELDVQVAAAGTSLANSSLTLGVSGSLTNDFILGANASTTVPAITVNGALNLNGAVNVTVTGTGLTGPNTYLLMSYGSISGSGSFVPITLPAVAGYIATLTNNTTAKQLQLVYTQVPQPVKWGVGDGDWDTTSLNWNLQTGAGPTNYLEGAAVLFDDTASGSSPITVTLSGNRSPSSITNNASKTYVLAGNPSIVGSPPLTMNGSGTFVISNGSANTFSTIAINAGTVAFDGSSGGQINSVAGNFGVGTTNGGSAALVLTNATTLNQLNSGTDVIIGNGIALSSTGAVNQAGGTFNSSGQIWIGQNTSGVGAFNLSGGTFNVDNWLAVGRQGGVGTFNLSGGVLYDAGGGGNLDIGTSAAIAGYNGSGTLNQTGGVITNTASSTWLGEGVGTTTPSGVWNMSGGTAQLGTLYVGYSGAGSGTLNISGTGAITCAGYVDIADQSTNNTGTVNIGSVSQPGGSLTAQGDLTVGDNGTGVINLVTNGGGVLTVEGTLYLSRSSSNAFGSVNLNSGGTIIADYVNNGYGFGHSLTNNPQAFNFNGGTLQPGVGSSFFIQPYVNAVVQAGGAVINDGGFGITILANLVDGGGGGGLTKLGNGTLYLNGGNNTYTGLTSVTAGTFGWLGTIAGPVTVASGATLDGEAGSIGTNYINNTLTLSAGSTTSMSLTPSSNEQIAGLTGVTYDGALVVTNTSASPLTFGSQFTLFNCTGPVSGNFSSVTILPLGAANGSFNPATGVLTIIPAPQPTINPPTVSGSNLILTGTGGTPSGSYNLLTTTNLTIPLADWTTNATGTFDGSGAFSNAIPIDPTQPVEFFLLQETQ